MSNEPRNDQPPYQPPNESSADGQNFEKKIRGACHCKKVVFWLAKDQPLAAKYCHCADCKIIHGAPFQWAAILDKSDMAFEKGVDGLRFYNQGSKCSEYVLPCKVSCSQCGTLIMDEGRNMILLFPTLLELDTDELRQKFEGQCHIFWPQNVVNIRDDKPKWEGIDGKSRRIE